MLLKDIEKLNHSLDIIRDINLLKRTKYVFIDYFWNYFVSQHPHEYENFRRLMKSERVKVQS